MSKATREFFDNLKAGKEPGKLETVLQGIVTAAPGLKNILSEIGAELKQMGAHGAHELSAALFNGSPFVMYQRGTDSVEDPQHGLPPEAQKDQGRQEQERSGREI